ncbi:DUF4013 domain-containing protein [Haloferax mediterranei ATCC 33500]|uniref:DUF4013 domain-containing protein n=1 Tax=Haloferax mediterranei (strain ATCC 33500 / DSM 1411 / JCM 8866 / NBRC 14739 / NCIMB 2177 / R-4) TaxID=523841 RepID=I3R8I6_HALMT|nr:DUF4013 domain-containing protein [Haloferax mediterranei]AFK20546.1 hypothetical protein HFX_2876 [Haloferax mediterranei ATCC 33500]AHZ23903.1 hypothetical protein BM92_15175 [Haloferax mediterranei ATCC 33500]ELZ98328.1 hypothetical protein C439_16125 [Haloferax mediterranei ATCC 33500]MDX5986699.1 DUF4013 domain-containing protein [Haloferax mediterranei ATCC 33500]QCQ76026.1 DUF4013 domain-containing protein [Haloferax mediterranei ATCC 33500]
MLSESIDYPRNGEDWVKTVLIGGVLTLLSGLIIPMFLVIGYLLRVVRATMKGDEEPPVFDEWGDMTIDGLKGFVIAFVYSLVPALIAGVFGFAGIMSAVAGNGSQTAGIFGGIVALVGLLVAFVLGLIAAYIIPAALSNYAETDRIGAAFDFGTLRPILTSGKYATAWLMAFVVLFAATVAISILNVIPFVGFIIGTIAGPFVTFYAAIAAYYIIGRTWGDLHDIEMMDEGGTTGEQPAV